MSRSARPPLSPEAAAVVRAMSGGRLSRRGLLAGAGSLGLGAFLAACGASASTGTADAGPPIDVSQDDRVIKWANWPLYLDRDDVKKSFPSLDDFRKKTGITAYYFEEINANQQYVDSIQTALSHQQDIGRDLIVLTDWMAAKLVSSGWVQPLDKEKLIPNAGNIVAKLKDPDWDRGRAHSLTWQSGYTGIAWNVAKLHDLGGKKELKNLDDLWAPALNGRVSVLSEMRDTMGLIMLSQGTDPSKPFAQDKFDAAMIVLEKQVQSGQIRQISGNTYKDDLVSGDAVAAIAWSGDILQLNTQARAADPTLTSDPYRFVLPESGGMLWSDNLLIPGGATHKANAQILMNYYYDPAVAAQVAAYVNYICPVQGAQQALLHRQGVDPAIANSPFVFPTAEHLAQVRTFRTLTAQEDRDYSATFQQVLGS